MLENLPHDQSTYLGSSFFVKHAPPTSFPGGNTASDVNLSSMGSKDHSHSESMSSAGADLKATGSDFTSSNLGKGGASIAATGRDFKSTSVIVKSAPAPSQSPKATASPVGINNGKNPVHSIKRDMSIASLKKSLNVCSDNHPTLRLSI